MSAFHDPVRQPQETPAQYRERTRKSAAIAKREQTRTTHTATRSGKESREARRRRETLAAKPAAPGPKFPRERKLPPTKKGKPVIGAKLRLKVAR